MSGVQIAASILNADLANLERDVRRVVAAGADRIHLDVMDGHFVPNLTFGAETIRALRSATDVPFDAHLMISEPARYVDQFLEAGCDTVTLHVEADEPIEATLRRIRDAGRGAGLAFRPATAVSALERYRPLLDIAMVMTVEPGFGGQGFIHEAARKIGPAHDVLASADGQVHVDGGVNVETAAEAAGEGADVLIVGSALFRAGTDPAETIAEIRRRVAGAAPRRAERRPSGDRA